ncbi:MAG: hypothetical protein IKO42_04260, partial [Opitutales bacterium]|nr:hypothetical protein [Opitutales bacterium]
NFIGLQLSKNRKKTKHNGVQKKEKIRKGRGAGCRARRRILLSGRRLWAVQIRVWGEFGFLRAFYFLCFYK